MQSEHNPAHTVPPTRIDDAKRRRSQYSGCIRKIGVPLHKLFFLYLTVFFAVHKLVISYLIDCFRCALTIQVVSCGVYSITLGGIQADLEARGGAEEPLHKTKQKGLMAEAEQQIRRSTS